VLAHILVEMDDLSHRRLENRRTALLSEFRTWLEGTKPADEVDELAADAETFLGWDLDYADAKLTQFDATDVDEYLLRWCPRKLSYPPADWMGVVDGLVAYLGFLGKSQNWTGSARQGEGVAAHARSRTEAFIEAMSDPSNFGMAKGMFMGPAFSGADIDLTDPSSLQAAVDRYNNLSFDERKALTDPFMAGRPGMAAQPDTQEAALRSARAAFNMPPVRIPADEQVRASALASPLRIAVEGLRQYLQPKGVVLTATGNFKMADCRTLVELLHTGDAFQYGPEGFVSQVRSMNHLRTLAFIFDVAAAAGATEIVGNRLWATAKWPDDEGLTAIELASVALSFETDAEIDGWYETVGPTLAGGLPYLIAPALGYGVTLAIEEMMPLALSAVLDGPRPSWVTEETAHTMVRHALQRLMKVMDLTGVISLVDDTVAMTPFGTQFMVRYMRQQGFEVPEQPSLQSLSAEQVLATITDATVWSASQAWQDWQPDWTDEQRCQAMVDALEAVPYELRTAHQRFGAFALLGEAPTPSVEPELRRLLDGPYSGYALTELATRGRGDIDELSDILGVMLPWVDKCYLDMKIDGAAAVIEPADELLADVGPGVLQVLSRLPIAEAAEVLSAIGSTHPSKQVAKLARTEVHKWRSRWSK